MRLYAAPAALGDAHVGDAGMRPGRQPRRQPLHEGHRPPGVGDDAGHIPEPHPRPAVAGQGGQEQDLVSQYGDSISYV